MHRLIETDLDYSMTVLITFFFNLMYETLRGWKPIQQTSIIRCPHFDIFRNDLSYDTKLFFPHIYFTSFSVTLFLNAILDLRWLLDSLKKYNIELSRLIKYLYETHKIKTAKLNRLKFWRLPPTPYLNLCLFIYNTYIIHPSTPDASFFLLECSPSSVRFSVLFY